MATNRHIRVGLTESRRAPYAPGAARSQATVSRPWRLRPEGLCLSVLVQTVVTHCDEHLRARRPDLHDLPRGLQLLYSQQLTPLSDQGQPFKALKNSGGTQLDAGKGAADTSEETCLLHTASLHSHRGVGSFTRKEYGGTVRAPDAAGFQAGGTEYQAGESKQIPDKRFPGSLASYVLVFQVRTCPRITTGATLLSSS